MEQAFKSMMTQATPNTFGANSPFPFSMPPQAGPTAPSSFPYSGPRKNTSPKGATVDVSATDVAATATSEAADVAETSKPSKKFGMTFHIRNCFLQLLLNGEWALACAKLSITCLIYTSWCIYFIFLSPYFWSPLVAQY